MKLKKFIIKHRKKFHILLGISLYIGISYFHIPLLQVLLLGAFIGVIFGKVFCRWLCPIGIFMEFMMSVNPNENFKSMYQYHKLGCPIAWIGGFLNKISIFRIKHNKNTCTDCGICDSSCYLSKLEPEKFSLYNPELAKPGDDYKCSKCLACVETCPNGSLDFK